MAIDPNQFEIIGDQPVTDGRFELVGDEPKPGLSKLGFDMSRVGQGPQDVYKLQESKSPALEDYSEAVPASLNPNYDFNRATGYGGPITASLGLAADAAGKGIVKLADIPTRISNIGKTPESPGYRETLEEREARGSILKLPRVDTKDLKGAPAVVAGLENTALGTAESFIGKPSSAFMLPLLGGEGALAKTAAGVYGVSAAAQVPDAVKKAIEVYNDPDSTTAEKTQAISDPIVQGTLSYLMLKHAGSREVAGGVQGPYALGRMMKTPEGAEAPLQVERYEPLDVQSGSPLSPQDLIARQSRVLTQPEAPTPEIKTHNLDEVEGVPNASEIPSTEGVSKSEVRPPVGEGTPLRQQGETPAAQANEPIARTGDARGATDEEASQIVPQEGEKLVTVKRPDGTTYQASFGGKYYDVSAGGQKMVDKYGPKPASIATLNERGKWTHGMLPKGDTIVEESPAPKLSEPELKDLGAATPSAFAPENQFTTSNKNAVVDKERAGRGLPPMMKVARESLGAVWDHAMSLIDNDHQIGTRLIKEISQTGKLASWLDTDTQNAILLHERISLRNSLDKSLVNLKRSVDDGYEPGIEENRLLSARLSDDLQELDSATRLAGTQLGRGLNARKMMAAEDYSLAAMETRKRGANNGKPLTDEQRAEIQSLHDKLKTQQDAYDKHVTELQQHISELEAKKETDAVVEDVKKEAKGKPTGIRDLVTEQINIKQGIEEKAQAGEPVTNLGNWIQKLARNFVEMGVRDSDKLVDSVHGILKDIFPGIDRKQVMDAISGYGDFKQLSKDEISVELRRMKGELQQLGKMEDMQAGKPPLKTGVERRTPGILERQRIKIVNEMKRRLGITVTDPAKQLQSALGSIKTRLKNEIDDLDFQIRTKERLVKTKTPTPLDAEAVALKEKRDTLKKQFDEIFGPREMTDAQRIQLASKQLDSRIAEVERQFKSGEIFPKGKQPSKTPVTPELAAKQAQLDALKEQRDWARDLIQPKPESDPAASALRAAKTRLKNRIAELQTKLANGDFSKRTRTPITLDEAGNKLRAEYEKTRTDFERGLVKDRLQKRSTFEKSLDGISKWRRTFVLSYPSILAKLTFASGELIGITPVEEAVGGALSKLPALSKVAEKAPRHGGFSLQSETEAIAGTWRTLFKAAGDKFKTGQSDIDRIYGDPKLTPKELKDFVSNIHAALKEPARQNEFFRSFRQRLNNAAKNGVDTTDPITQTKIGFEAYKDANRQIFTEKNMLADAFNRALTRFGQADKSTGKPSAFGKTAETIARYELPVVRIPLNIIKRTFEYSFGTVVGSARLAKAIANGLDTLSPEQADVIMRNMKRGSLGLAVVAIGYFNPDSVGGYYQRGQKRDPRDVAAGGLRIGGVNIPRALIHNPLLEQLQIGATIRRVVDSKLHKRDQENQSYPSAIMAAYGGLIENAPFVRQAEDSLKALNPTERGQFLGELLKSTVPGVAQWAAQQLDRDASGNQIQRKPTTPGQYFESAVPGLRENVPVKHP